jgi:hypothetical protein
VYDVDLEIEAGLLALDRLAIELQQLGGMWTGLGRLGEVMYVAQGCGWFV